MDKHVVKTTPCLWCGGVMEMHYKWSRITAFIVAVAGMAFGVLVLITGDGGDKIGGMFGIICVVISP